MASITKEQNAKNLELIRAAQAKNRNSPITGTKVVSTFRNPHDAPVPVTSNRPSVKCTACNKEHFLPTSCTCGAIFENQTPPPPIAA